MYPSIKQAEQELELAYEKNPGPWTKHSKNTGIAARNIASKISGMNAQKAYVLGMLHDIGRRVGIVSIPKHVYEGYKYCMEHGWDEVARVCLTHSYPLMKAEFNFIPDTEEEIFIKEHLLGYKIDDYDRLLQLCDGLAVDYGFCILEKRFVDIVRRYGMWENTLQRWDVTYNIKADFEKRMGCNLYDVLPDIGETTLLSPPVWQPDIKGFSWK